MKQRTINIIKLSEIPFNIIELHMLNTFPAYCFVEYGMDKEDDPVTDWIQKKYPTTKAMKTVFIEIDN